MTTLKALLAQAILERIEGCGIKGPKRQAEAALNMVCGAIYMLGALNEAGNQRELTEALQDKSLNLLAVLIATRGIGEVHAVATAVATPKPSEAVSEAAEKLEKLNIIARYYKKGLAMCRATPFANPSTIDTLEGYAWRAGFNQDGRSPDQILVGFEEHVEHIQKKSKLDIVSYSYRQGAAIPSHKLVGNPFLPGTLENYAWSAGHMQDARSYSKILADYEWRLRQEWDKAHGSVGATEDIPKV